MPLDLETREQLIATVRRFVRETCVLLEAKVAEDDRVPDDVIAEMRALGLFGISIPEEYGGSRRFRWRKRFWSRWSLAILRRPSVPSSVPMSASAARAL